MTKDLKKQQKTWYALLGLSVAIIILGILFLLNAMQDMEDPNNIGFFPAFCAIDNVLAKYIVVQRFCLCAGIRGTHGRGQTARQACAG